MNRGILFGGSVALIIVVGIFFWPKLGQSPSILPDQISDGIPSSPDQEFVACTMDAKMCPDGTYVGRSGPLCEFEVCPEGGVASPVEGMGMWQTYTSNELTFRYPDDFGTTYIQPVSWPPVIEQNVMSVSYTCREGVNVEKRVIQGREYCRTVSGKEVGEYTYVIEDKKSVITFQLSITMPDCKNYTGTQKEECELETMFFDLDSVIDQIYRTVEFK